MVDIGTSLQRILLDSPQRGWCGAVVDQWMIQQLLCRALDRITIVGVRVLISRDDERATRRQSTELVVIVVNVARSVDVIRPEANLIEITSSITIFRSIKGGRRWMTDQEMKDLSID